MNRNRSPSAEHPAVDCAFETREHTPAYPPNAETAIGVARGRRTGRGSFKLCLMKTNYWTSWSTTDDLVQYAAGTGRA
jgi:hypothetical protein